jgi:hypothetical protein
MQTTEDALPSGPNSLRTANAFRSFIHKQKAES